MEEYSLGYTIDAQIKEVEFEIKMRKNTYSKLVRAGKMKKETAREKYDTMISVLHTLHAYKDMIKDNN